MNIEVLQKKLQAVEKRCNVWKKENERLVLRQKVLLEYLTKLQNDRSLLVEKLKTHKDAYHQAAKHYYSYLKDEPGKEDDGSEAVSVLAVGESLKKKKKIFVESKKKEKVKDKDMPKKPNNPYFQFCLEQRSIVEEEHATGHLSQNEDPKSKGLSKPHLIKILAGRWKQLSEEEKKVYIQRYQVDKERYAVEKSQYSANRATL